MENYFFLAEQFRTQDEPTFCGLSTLAMVLNALRIDPMRTWKGAWRWYSEAMLSCQCTGLDKVREEGISFDLFRSLAGCHGALAVPHRAPVVAQERRPEHHAFVDAFRAAVKAVSASGERESLVVCYSRESLGQTGAGHFSPIGGYHAATDSVLIMDVARFKYPPHWAPVTKVAEAMATIDGDSGNLRGFLHLRLPLQELDSSQSLRPLFVPFVPAASGTRLAEALMESLASQCTALAGEPASRVAMRRWLHAASVVEPQVMRQLLKVGDASAFSEVLDRLDADPLYRELRNAYAALTTSHGGFMGVFPPLCLGADTVDIEVCTLSTCGEMWVMLLLLLPDYLRAAVWPDLDGPAIAQSMANAVRGPWALPLEALRETIVHVLPKPGAASCRRPAPDGSSGFR